MIAVERKERLYPLLHEMERVQDDHKRIGCRMGRIVRSMELLVVEKALKSILRHDEAPTWHYQAARGYAERNDSRHGTGLIPPRPRWSRRSPTSGGLVRNRPPRGDAGPWVTIISGE